MQCRKLWSIVLVVSLLLSFGLTQSAFATERIVKLKLNGFVSAEAEMIVRNISMQTPGVINADASYIGGSATVTYDDEKVTLEQIIRRYQNNNFRVMGKPEIIK